MMTMMVMMMMMMMKSPNNEVKLGKIKANIVNTKHVVLRTQLKTYMCIHKDDVDNILDGNCCYIDGGRNCIALVGVPKVCDLTENSSYRC